MKTTEEIMFNEEEREFRNELRAILEKEMKPKMRQQYEEDIYPRDIYEKLGEKGFLGQLLPPEYGGRGKILYDAIVAEELGAYGGSIGYLHGTSSYAYGTILEFGNEEQKKKFLPPMKEGKKLGSIVITEEEAGSDVTMIKTKAEPKGDYYILNGEKRSITNGGEPNNIELVWVITNPDVDPAKGTSCFIVEPEMEGFEVVGKHGILGGIPGVRNYRLRFTNMKVPQENMIGGENDGFRVMMDELALERALYALFCVGGARVALELSTKYSTQRVQFGVPLRRFEEISFRIADMATKLEAARLVSYHTIRLMDEGNPAEKESAMAKLIASEAYSYITTTALQIYGDRGVSSDVDYDAYMVEWLFRHGRLSMIPTGTVEIMRFIIQREIYKELKRK
jgi:hypothetical protein